VVAALAADEADGGADGALDGALDAARAAGDAEVEVLVLDAIARFRAGRGDPAGARTALAAADAAARAADHLFADAGRVDREPALALLARAG
jgi:hypothetical protein